MRCISLWQPYLAGVLHGDGWCTSKSIGLRSKDRDFVDVFAECLAHAGSLVTPRLDERGYWVVITSHKNGRHSLLREYSPRDDDERAAWLRGLFDSEGNAQLWHMPHASPNAYHRRVAMYSTDLKTLEMAAEHLATLSIPHSIRQTNNSASHKGSKTVHELRIVRREGFSKFTEVVGTSILRKRDRLRAICDTYQDPNIYCARGGTRGIATRLARRDAGGVF